AGDIVFDFADTRRGWNKGLIQYYKIEGVLDDEEVRCWTPDYMDFDNVGIVIDIPNSTYVDDQSGQEISDLLEIQQVVVKGWATTDNVIITGLVSNPAFKVYCTGRESFFNLNDGNDYAWGFDSAGNLKLVLGVGVTAWDEHLIQDHGVDIIHPDWIWNGPYWTTGELGVDDLTGMLGGPGDDYFYWQHTGGSANGPAFVISEIWAIVKRKISSVTIKDPKGNSWPALYSLQYELYPMIKFDPPPAKVGRSDEPDGYDGIVDHTTCLFDHDPTTV
ncbi:unnamed protein product, partial [marine sediment metagenome]